MRERLTDGDLRSKFNAIIDEMKGESSMSIKSQAPTDEIRIGNETKLVILTDGTATAEEQAKRFLAEKVSLPEESLRIITLSGRTEEVVWLTAFGRIDLFDRMTSVFPPKATLIMSGTQEEINAAFRYPGYV